MNEQLDALYARARVRWGEKFDDTDLRNAPSLIRSLYGTDARVIVETRYPDGATLRIAGRVGVTTGWKPSFMLLHRRDSIGSSNLIGATEREDGTTTEVVAVQAEDGRYYGTNPEGARRTWGKPYGVVAAPRSSFGDYTEAPSLENETETQK